LIFFPQTWVIPGRNRHLTSKPQIVIARHISRNDIPLVQAALPWNHHVLYIARKGLKLLKWLERSPRLLQAIEGKYIIFVERNADETQKQKEVNQIQEALKTGWAKYIIIFPETATLPKDQELNPGFVTLARRYRLMIRPVNIIRGGCYGRCYGEKPLKVLTFQAASTHIRVGQPFSVTQLKSADRHENRGILAERAMERIDAS